METHAHHLHKAPGKNFWHYFFEFFMLFLAVFCGFLAENFREHKVEKNREEEYVRNLYEDLKGDTAIYSAYFRNCDGFLSGMDSAITLMSHDDRNSNAPLIYYLFRTSTLMTANVTPNDRTFDQMQSSGSLRLISDHKVADSISTYYHSLKGLAIQNEVIMGRLADYMSEVGKVMDATVLYNILKTRAMPEGTVKFVTNDPLPINLLLTRAQYFYGSRMLQRNWVKERAKRAANLIELIKQEYHIE